jgi:threonine dehydratase
MSPSMFGVVRSMVDGFVGIEDTWTFEAMKRLNTPVAPDIGINAGAAGAAGLAGLLATIRAPELADLRRTVLAGGDARVLVIATEGG